MKQVHVVARASQPGVSRSNVVAERAVRASLEVTRALLAQAGVPACVRGWAAPRGAFLSNLDPSSRRLAAGEEFAGKSPYEMASGGPFLGQTI
eukprot:14371537-Alexandrium_andersonii.AAC.1